MQTKTIEVPEGLIKHGGNYLAPVDADGYKGYRIYPLEPLLGITPRDKIGLEWHGGKMFVETLWHPLCAFFEAQYALTGGEAQARLFYNPKDKTWKAWAFPQEWSTGMTTKELPDHPGWKEQDEAIGADYIVWGTVHHHCKWSAFQSGVDRENEVTQNGIHITIGKISLDEYELHGRICFGGIHYDCLWSEWFHLNPLPNWVYKINDAGERSQAVKWIMERFGDLTKILKAPPPKDTPFPKQWIENLIKPVYGNGGGHSGHTFPHAENQGQGAYSSQGFHGSRSVGSFHLWKPTTRKFLGEAKVMHEQDPLAAGIKQTLLEELSVHHFVNSGNISENCYREKFRKLCFDNDIRPPKAGARLLLQHLLPEKMSEDQETILTLICSIGADHVLFYNDMVKVMCDVMARPDTLPMEDVHRSCVYHLRQLSPEIKMPMEEMAELFFDFVNEEWYDKCTAELMEKHLATDGMVPESQFIDGYGCQ
jgi:hypothetical protein